MNVLARSKAEIFDLSESSRLDCTLYELIAALIDEAGPKEDGLVVSAALDLFASGKIEWKNTPLRSKRKPVLQVDFQNNDLIAALGNI